MQPPFCPMINLKHIFCLACPSAISAVPMTPCREKKTTRLLMLPTLRCTATILSGFMKVQQHDSTIQTPHQKGWTSRRNGLGVPLVSPVSYPSSTLPISRAGWKRRLYCPFSKISGLGQLEPRRTTRRQSSPVQVDRISGSSCLNICSSKGWKAAKSFSCLKD